MKRLLERQAATVTIIQCIKTGEAAIKKKICKAKNTFRKRYQNDPGGSKSD